MIKETKVQPYRIEQICDNCGGMMRFLGKQLPTNPPVYPHQCEVCGHGEQFKDIYPAIRYYSVDEDE